MYHEEGYDYGKGVVLNMVELLHCILPKGCTHLFWIHSNYKLCCLNLEADQVALVLQVGAALPVEIKHIIQRVRDLF